MGFLTIRDLTHPEQRKEALIRLNAEMKRIEYLAEASIKDTDILLETWDEIVLSVQKLRWELGTRDEQEWEKNKFVDLRDRALIEGVRERDGDTCQICERTVNWQDRKGERGGTYTHLVPGKSAESVKDIFVICRACDRKRLEDVNRGLAVPLPNYLVN